MVKTVKDRLLEYIDYKGLSTRLFERTASISNGYINNLKASPSSAILQKIFSAYPDINPMWLTSGIGSMLNSSDVNIENFHLQGNSIPLIPLSAMAGEFMGERQVLECECERYVIPAFHGVDFLIHVKGDSMHPNYKSGDIVACKRVPMERLFFQWNHVYVLNTDQGGLIKRVQPGKDEKHVLIVSDNEAYAPFELPLQCIYNVALVMGTIRLE